jgi:hypothetical protein
MFNTGDQVEALRHIASGWQPAVYVSDATETESGLPGAAFEIQRHMVRFTPGADPVIVGTVRKPAA